MKYVVDLYRRMEDSAVMTLKDMKHKRVAAKILGAAMAMMMTMLCVFAEGEGSGTDYIGSVTSAMSSSLESLVGKIAAVCAGLVGVALTVFGIKWASRVIKSFFSKIAG